MPIFKKKFVRKKHHSSLPVKRKRFGTIFIKKWLGLLLLTILAYMAGLLLFVNQAQNHAKDIFQQRNTTMVEFINKTVPETSAKPIINKIRLQLCAYAEAYGITYLLCDTDNLDSYISSEENFFLIRKNTSDSEAVNSTIYNCPTSAIAGWEEHRMKMDAFRKDHPYLIETFLLNSFYTNGKSFYPADLKVAVSYYEDDDSPLVVMTYSGSGTVDDTSATDDTSTKDITREEYLNTIPNLLYFSEFTAAEDGANIQLPWTDEDYLHPLCTGYSPFNPYLAVSGTHEAYSFLMNSYENFKNGGSLPTQIGVYEEREALDLTLFARENLTLSTGENVTLLCSYHFDAWGTYGKHFIIAAVLLLLFSLLFAFVFSHISYAGLKAHYDMEDYRKTLMNTMAHDLKTPLMGISGYAENLRDNIHSDKREYYANAILKNVQHMDGLITSILALSQAEDKGVYLEKSDTNIGEMLRIILGKYAVQSDQMHLTPVLSGELILNVDPTLFSRALENLVDNAYHYAAADSSLKIELSEKSIQFTNDYPKDLSHIIEHLCEPFVTADESRSVSSGSGLGLALVKNICEFHGFTFEVSCENGQFKACIFV